MKLWTRNNILVALCVMAVAFGGAGLSRLARLSRDWQPTPEQAFEAAKSGDAGTVDSYISHGGNVNWENKDYELSLLQAACAYGQEAAASRLLTGGAQINDPNRFGWTPLHFAANSGKERLVALLLSRGARADVRNCHGCLPVHYAAELLHGAGLDLLIGRGHLDVRDNEGKTPLAHAVECYNQQAAWKLTSSGADVNVKNNYGYTPLYQVVRNGWLALASSVVKQGGKEDIFVASGLGDTKWVGQYLQRKGNPNVRDGLGYSPLHWACANAQFDAAKMLIATGADVNALNSAKITPLIITLNEDSLPAQSRFNSPQPDAEARRRIVGLLLQSGAAVHIRDCFGNAAVDYARAGRYSDPIALLTPGGTAR